MRFAYSACPSKWGSAAPHNQLPQLPSYDPETKLASSKETKYWEATGTPPYWLQDKTSNARGDKETLFHPASLAPTHKSCCTSSSPSTMLWSKGGFHHHIFQKQFHRPAGTRSWRQPLRRERTFTEGTAGSC